MLGLDILYVEVLLPTVGRLDLLEYFRKLLAQLMKLERRPVVV